MPPKERSRLSIDIDHSLRQDLDDLRLPWGSKQHIFPCLVRAFIRFCKTVGTPRAYMAILEEKIKISLED